MMNKRITVDRVPVTVIRSKETEQLVSWCNKLSEAFNALSKKVEKLERSEK